MPTRAQPVDRLEPRQLLSGSHGQSPVAPVAAANPDPVRLDVFLSTGEVRIVNDNPADPGEIGSYEITSASGAMNAALWTSLADQAVAPGWGELIANDDYVAENTNNPAASSPVPEAGLSLGLLFRTDRPHDLALLYGDETNQTFEGTVNYVGGTPPAQVVGRRTFYNHSAFDGGDPLAAPQDDVAVDPGKQALRPGGAATFANLTSYARGINGIMVDIKGLPDVQPAPSDFAFRARPGTGADWVPGPAPSQVTVRRGAGAEGSDRVTLVWPDYNRLDAQTRPQQAVANGWLEVTVNAGVRTGLAQADVFSFGNLIGETGDDARARPQGPPQRVVNAFDYARTRSAVGTTTADVANPYDFNRDRKVDGADVLIGRSSLGYRLSMPAAAPAALSWTPAPAVAALDSPARLNTAATELVRRVPPRGSLFPSPEPGGGSASPSFSLGSCQSAR